MNKKLINWYLGGASNNSYVQGALDRASVLGYTAPSNSTITALNTFFNSINSYMASAEMIKIYALNNASLSNFSTINYVSPSNNQTTLVNSPTYGVNGFISNGTSSYLNENITVNRRAGIESNVSSLVSINSASTANTLNTACGAQVSTGTVAHYLMRPKNDASATSYLYTNTYITSYTNTSHDGFYSLNSNGTSNTRMRYGKNGTYVTDSGANPFVAPNTSNNIFTCAWNFGGSPIQYYNNGDIEFRWEGYRLADADIDAIRTAFQTYLTAIGL